MKRFIRRHVWAVVWTAAVPVGLLMPSSAVAIVSQWLGGNGDFGDPLKWDNGVPASGDTAEFTQNETATITFASTHTNNTLNLQAGNITFRSIGLDQNYSFPGAGTMINLSGGTLTLGVLDDPLDIPAVADLNITNNAAMNVLFGSEVRPSDLSLGQGVGGSLTVSGAGSLVDLTLALNMNAGVLNIDSGGVFRFGNAASTATGGSQINVNGGTLDVSSDLTLSSDSTLNFSDGDVIVGFFDTLTFNNSFLYGGTGGANPHFQIIDGGEAVVTFAFRLGETAGSMGELTISGGNGTQPSTLRNTGGGGGADLTVGRFGTGVLTVSDGGLAEFNDDFILANEAGSMGTATVTGVRDAGGTPIRSTVRTLPGSAARDVEIGRNGTGLLTIENGALVQSNGDTFLGRSDLVAGAGNGSITLGGQMLGFDATLNVGGSLGIGSVLNAGSVVNRGVGTVTINDGGVVNVTANTQISDDDELIINAGGVFNSGTGQTQVTGTGRIFMSGGTYNANGDIELNGGDLMLDSGGTLNMSPGTTLSVTNSGSAAITGNITLEASESVLVNSGTFSLDGDMTIDGGSFTRQSGSLLLVVGSTVTVQNGGQLTIVDTYEVDQTNIINLSGEGSTLDFTGFRFRVQGNSLMNVTGGADALIHTNFDVGNIGDGTLFVSDPGSTVVADPSNEQMWWGRNGNNASVTFTNGATGSFLGGVEMGNAFASEFTATATTTVSGGAMVTFGDLDLAALGISDGAAVLTVTGAGSQVTIDGSSYLHIGKASGGSATVNLQNGGGLSTGTGETVVGATGIINLDGGTLTLNGPTDIGEGRLNFASGVINVSDPTQVLVADSTGNAVGGLMLGSSFVIGTGRTLNLAGSARVDLGGQLTLGGGSLTNASLLVQASGSVVNSGGSSTVTGPVLALAGSTVNVAGGDLAIGDAAAVNGFYSSGTVWVAGGSTLTLQDANDAAFDTAALVTLGDATAGTVTAANGLTLDFGANATGFGTVNTPDSVATPLINNGHIAGNSPAEPITLTGYIIGVGTLDNVVITGTDAPGFSTAAVVRGSVTYDGMLEIEIGGTAPSSSYDQIFHILGAGIADLGGMLDVELINGFSPAVDDAFEIITASGAVNGTFATTAAGLPTLGPGLAWAINYGTNNVVLSVIAAGLPGDYNNDGKVDAADYVVWRKNPASFGGDPAGYNTWRANFGSSNNDGNGAGTTVDVTGAVPEPASILLWLCAGGLLFCWRLPSEFPSNYGGKKGSDLFSQRPVPKYVTVAAGEKSSDPFLEFALVAMGRRRNMKKVTI